MLLHKLAQSPESSPARQISNVGQGNTFGPIRAWHIFKIACFGLV